MAALKVELKVSHSVDSMVVAMAEWMVDYSA